MAATTTGRANWKGHLRLSLVSCAVALYPAVGTAGRLKCHTVNRRTGNRINEEVIDSVTREPVPKEDRVKGCEAVAKGDLVAVEEDELAAIRLESTHTINIEHFVKQNEVDRRYFDRPYYLAPEDKLSREAFAVIRDAMRRKDVAGLARLVIFKRERVVLLEPYEQGMLATLLHAEDAVRSPTAVFEGLGAFDAPAPMRDLAEELIERHRGAFDPARFEDRYEQALIALVQAKAAKGSRPRSRRGAETAAGAAQEASNVVSLMDALKRSIAAEKSGGRRETADRPDAPRGSKPSSRAARAKTPAPAHKKRAPLRKAS